MSSAYVTLFGDSLTYKPMSCKELQQEFRVTQPHASWALRKMRQAGLIQKVSKFRLGKTSKDGYKFYTTTERYRKLRKAIANEDRKN